MDKIQVAVTFNDTKRMECFQFEIVSYGEHPDIIRYLILWQVCLTGEEERNICKEKGDWPVRLPDLCPVDYSLCSLKFTHI